MCTVIINCSNHIETTWPRAAPSSVTYYLHVCILIAAINIWAGRTWLYDCQLTYHVVCPGHEVMAMLQPIYYCCTNSTEEVLELQYQLVRLVFRFACAHPCRCSADILNRPAHLVTYLSHHASLGCKHNLVEDWSGRCTADTFCMRWQIWFAHGHTLLKPSACWGSMQTRTLRCTSCGKQVRWSVSWSEMWASAAAGGYSDVA